MAKAKNTLLDRETERAEPVALDGVGTEGQAENMALLDTTGRQVVEALLEGGETLKDGEQVDVSEQDAAGMGHVSEEYTADTIRLLEGVEHVRTRRLCISAIPGRTACITCCLRLSTTPLTKCWRAMQRKSG